MIFTKAQFAFHDTSWRFIFYSFQTVEAFSNDHTSLSFKELELQNPWNSKVQELSLKFGRRIGRIYFYNEGVLWNFNISCETEWPAMHIFGCLCSWMYMYPNVLKAYLNYVIEMTKYPDPKTRVIAIDYNSQPLNCMNWKLQYLLYLMKFAWCRKHGFIKTTLQSFQLLEYQYVSILSAILSLIAYIIDTFKINL